MEGKKVITREAWYRELIAFYGESDLNDPGTLGPYLQSPHAYSVGYDLEVMKDSVQGKWETVRHGPLAQGDFTPAVVQKLREMPARWYAITDTALAGQIPGRKDPTVCYVWQMDLEGQWPFGSVEWDIFGLSSKEWEALAEQYEDPYDSDSRIRAEVQFQLRPAGGFKKVDEKEERAQEVLQNARKRARDLFRRLIRTRVPPSYSSPLPEQYREFQSFLGKLNLEDLGMMGRFLKMERDLLSFHENMNEAVQEAVDSSTFTMVGVSPGLYEYILTEDEAPEETPEERHPEFGYGQYRS